MKQFLFGIAAFALGQRALRYFRSRRAKGDAGRGDSGFTRKPGWAQVITDFEHEVGALKLEWETGARTKKDYRRALDDLEDKLNALREEITEETYRRALAGLEDRLNALRKTSVE